MIYRIASLFLIFALCISASACGIIIPRDPNGDETASQTDRPSETTAQTAASDTTAGDTAETTTRNVRPVETTDSLPIAEKYLSELPEWDFDGVSVTIVSPDVETFAPTSDADVVYNARIERNRMVEEKYNTMVMVTHSDPDTMYEELRNAIKSGDYYADIAALPQTEVGRFYAAGLTMNMMSLPFTDYTAPYYNAKATEQLTVGSDVVGAVGDFNENLDYLYGLYFNRDMAEALGYDLYGAVYDGTWDWDMFRRITKDAASDVDGNKVYGHGAAVDINTYMSIMFASSGVDFFECERGEIPSLSYGSSSSLSSTVDKVVRSMRYALGTDDTVFVSGRGEYTTDGAMDAFVGGELLFYTERLYFTSWIAGMDHNWGILPMPNVSGDKYYSFAALDQPVVTVPYGSANTEQTGLFLQAANAASYGWLEDVFYEDMQINIVRDGDTLNMLDLISGRRGGTIMYSFAYMFGQAFPNTANATYGALYKSAAGNTSMSSNHDAYAEAVEKELAKVVKVR